MRTVDTFRFLASELPPAAPKDCLFQVIPVPFEATVSYGGGTEHGPAAILEASSQLELWTGACVPAERGIYTWPAVPCSGTPEEVLERIEQAVEAALDGGVGKKGGAQQTLPVLLGGEHTVTLGALRALKKRYGRFGVIHFDAHADLRESYEGSRFSHACVMRRAVDDLGLALFQIGVRSLSGPEVAYREARGIGHLDAREMAEQGGPGVVLRGIGSLLPSEFPETVYLSFDVDAFDSSLMPATGTPEPGGLFWWEALLLARRALAGRRLIGFDVVELAPIRGMHAPSFLAARLVYELMGESLQVL